MNTMLNNISTILSEKNIDFDVKNQHVRCLAHIINLAVQKFLESLNASGPNDENSLENDVETENKLKNIIYRVSLYLLF